MLLSFRAKSRNLLLFLESEISRDVSTSLDMTELNARSVNYSVFSSKLIFTS